MANGCTYGASFLEVFFLLLLPFTIDVDVVVEASSLISSLDLFLLPLLLFFFIFSSPTIRLCDATARSKNDERSIADGGGRLMNRPSDKICDGGCM